MQTYFFPSLGGKAIASITAPMLLDVLRLVEKRGIIETTHTLKQSAGQVFRYGIQTGKCERNPAADLQGALKPIVTKHIVAILEPAKVGEFLRACEGYSGHTAIRVALLNEIKPLTGPGVYVFPSTHTQSRPMSDVTLNAAMRRMGFTKDEMTAHGFRAMARTLIRGATGPRQERAAGHGLRPHRIHGTTPHHDAAVTMKCPCCGAAELIHDTRDISYSYKGEATSIPTVTLNQISHKV